MAVAPDPTPGTPSGRPFLAFAPLVRAVTLAADPRKLILAALGLGLLYVGWFVIQLAPGRNIGPVARSPRPFLDTHPLGKVGRTGLLQDLDPYDAATQIIEPAVVVVEPFGRLFSRRTGLDAWSRSLGMGVWALVVWGLIGGAIARVAAVQQTVGGGVGILSAVRFALGRWLALIGAPLTPFLAVAVLSLGLAGFGLLYYLPVNLAGALTGVLGFVPVLIGLILALILLGLALAWPLMHATVAAEGEDVADALSRSYSYINQRLVRYLAHLAVAAVLGIFGLIGLTYFARVVLGLADWGVALGAPLEPPSAVSNRFRGFWSDTVGWLVHAYAYSYFWTATTAIYLILRRDVDGTDPSDVYLPEQALDTFAGTPDPLPPAPPAPGDSPA